MKKTILLLICLISFITSVFSQNYGNLTYSEAINISGKQRMLSQKIAKTYLLKLTELKLGSDEYKKATQTFNENLNLLINNSSTSLESTKLSIEEEKKQWVKFLNVLMLNPTDNVDKIILIANGLLNNCKDLVSKIESESGGTSNKPIAQEKTVNLSGKQRMLSQRTALYYVAASLSTSDDQKTQYISEVKRILELLKSSNDNLAQNPLNTPDINSYLSKVRTKINMIESSKADNLSIDLTELMGICNEITSTYNTITGIYASI